MVELTPYGIRVVDRINMILMFIVCVVCVRNAAVCIKQYKRTKGTMYEFVINRGLRSYTSY